MATSSYSTIPGGKEAEATAYGQQAYASGAFAVAGDAQASLYVLRNTTNDTSTTELFLDGVGERILVPAGRAMVFDILIMGRSTSGTTTFMHLVGFIENTGGTTSVPYVVEAHPQIAQDGSATAVAEVTSRQVV